LRFLGFNWAAFAQDLLACGGFSATFGPGTALGTGEETFLQWKMQQRGIGARYLPEALAWHYVPPERCSPEWTLRRARGGGFNAGVLVEHQDRMRLVRTRPARHMARAFRRMTGKRDVIDLFCLRKEGIYWLKYTSRWLRAYRDGMMFGRQCRPLEDGFWNGIGTSGQHSAVANGR
jgi:hypothetical protein